MNKAPWIFLGVLFTLSLSWWGMVYGPAAQLGGQSATNDDGTAVLPRVGLAQQGEQVYRANGCYYCHTRTATGGEFGYELRLTQFGDSYEMTEEIIGPALKDRDADRQVIRLGFEFKKLAGAKKAFDEANKALTDNAGTIQVAGQTINKLSQQETLTVEEKTQLAEIREALAEANEATADLKKAADVAGETLPIVIAAFNTLREEVNRNLTQQVKKDTNKGLLYPCLILKVHKV